MIYVHVPFCRSLCTYCGFYSEAAPKCRKAEQEARQEAIFEEFSQALTAEVLARRQEFERVFAPGGVNTLYAGGGTPSVLPLPAFARLLSVLRQVGVDTDFKEFTVEVNPEDIVDKGEDYVKGLLEFGVNRVSMGVQSFDQQVLKFMNRRHSPQDAVRAYNILESAGVDNISIDLIFGLPQLSSALWEQTIEKALEISARGIPPRHISAYQLSVEPGSMLEKLIQKDRWEEAPERQCEEQYGILCEALGRAGYHHYEVSNFAQPGFEAVHNSAYWKHIPYIGLGPGAHSFGVGSDGLPERRWNKESIRDYLTAAGSGDFSIVQEGERLDAQQMVMEKVMLGLRTSAGVAESYLRDNCSCAAVDESLSTGSLVRVPGGRLRIPENRFFVSDNIISSII